MNKTVYVAAPWTRRVVAKEVATMLTQTGYQIAHDWWAHEAGDEDHTQLKHLAQLDYFAVLNCDLFILLNLEKSEGKAVESGLALSRVPRPRMIGVGSRYSNIFHNLDAWEWVDKLNQLKTFLRPDLS